MGERISGEGPPWGHEAGGRALHPRGQVVDPPAVFLVPNILKYSRKNHISISGHFSGYFLLHG